MAHKHSNGAGTASQRVLDRQTQLQNERYVKDLYTELESITEIAKVIGEQLEGEISPEIHNQHRRIISQVTHREKARLQKIRSAIKTADFSNVTVKDLTLAALIAYANKGLAPKSSQVAQLSSTEELVSAIKKKSGTFNKKNVDEMSSANILGHAENILDPDHISLHSLAAIQNAIQLWINEFGKIVVERVPHIAPQGGVDVPGL